MSKSRIQSVRWGAIRSALITLTALAMTSVSVAAGSSAASAPAPTAPTAPASAAVKTAPSKPVKLIDINSASRQELKTLPGVNDAVASKIIANRPYLTKTELVSKAGLQVGPYVSLKHLVVAKQKGPPPKPKP